VFWGPYAHLFLPNSNSSLPLHATLSEVQVSRFRRCWAGGSHIAWQPLRSHIQERRKLLPMQVSVRDLSRLLLLTTQLYRDCALDDSCVLCSWCFHATDHTTHNVSFFIAQQSGGCCYCGDEEAWRIPIGCPFHPQSPHSTEMTETRLHAAPKAIHRAPLGHEIPPVKNYPHRFSVPPDLREIMARTVGYALDFTLDTWIIRLMNHPFRPSRLKYACNLLRIP
jgi:E3 ubiquitin-protein ligase UBR1